MNRVVDKKAVFEVFHLDVYMEDGGWVENERHRLGKLEVWLLTRIGSNQSSNEHRQFQ